VTPLTRREALGAALGAALAVGVPGCDGGGRPSVRPGSTLRRTVGDLRGDGRLALGPAEPLVERTELGSAGRATAPLASLVHLTDVHLRDAETPARVSFLDRLGPGYAGAFRPQEALLPHVLAGALTTLRRIRVRAVVLGGDLVESAQANELAWALGLLHGRRVRPDSGRRGYTGPQSADNPDPVIYRPDIDAPRHPDLLRRALAPLRAPALTGPLLPVLGNHDALVGGELPVTPAITRVATGARRLVEPDASLLSDGTLRELTPPEVDAVLSGGLPGRTVATPPDPRRAPLSADAVVSALRTTARGRADGAGSRLDYVADLGSRVRLVALDLVQRDGGSGGQVTESTLAFLQAVLAGAGERWVLLAVHQPLEGSDGGERALALLDAHPRVAAVLAGHTHRNRIRARRGPSGGYWLIETCSLVDWPQQVRALRVLGTAVDGLVLETWMLDHAGRPDDDADLAGLARELAYLDAQGGRPNGAAGRRRDRNVRLHLPPPGRGTRRAAPPSPSLGARPAEPGFGDGF
jgi:3',5'-cyclic AMP phosphodiesterase CpdA